LAAINLVKKNKNEYASTYKKYIDNDPWKKISYLIKFNFILFLI
jgi:hypothetical protein